MQALAAAAVEVEGEEDACAICMANSANAKLAPCKHMGVCAACALELMRTTRRCPLCLADVQFSTGVAGGGVVVLAAPPPPVVVEVVVVAPPAAAVVVVEVAAVLDVDVEVVVAAVEVEEVVVVEEKDDEDDDEMLVIDVEICDDVVVVD